MDDEDDYQRERDSQMRRQREEAIKSQESSRTIQTKYPKNIREQDLREARRRRLGENFYISHS